MVTTAAVLAHAGGFSWDEALLVMTPLAIVGVLLRLANRRARGLGEDDDAELSGDVTEHTG